MADIYEQARKDQSKIGGTSQDTEGQKNSKGASSPRSKSPINEMNKKKKLGDLYKGIKNDIKEKKKNEGEKQQAQAPLPVTDIKGKVKAVEKKQKREEKLEKLAKASSEVTVPTDKNTINS